jgi:hypothetical protein
VNVQLITEVKRGEYAALIEAIGFVMQTEVCTAVCAAKFHSHKIGECMREQAGINGSRANAIMFHRRETFDGHNFVERMYLGEFVATEIDRTYAKLKEL